MQVPVAHFGVSGLQVRRCAVAGASSQNRCEVVVVCRTTSSTDTTAS
jgi:hypothetical protein